MDSGCVEAEGKNWSFEYGFVARHRGLVLSSFLFLALGAFAGYVAVWGVRPLDRDAYGVLGTICLLGLIIGVAVERVGRQFHGRITVSEAGIQLKRLTGDLVEIRWDTVEGVLPFTRWHAWGKAGGGHSGLRIVSAAGEIVIYRSINGWDELRSLVEERAAERGIPSIQSF